MRHISGEMSSGAAVRDEDGVTGEGRLATEWKSYSLVIWWTMD